MKNLKNFVSSFLIVSILSMNAGVFISPVFAFGKDDVNSERNENNLLSKISKEGSYIKKEFRERAITDRQTETGLSKNKIKSLESSKNAQRINKGNKNYVEGEVLVKFKEQKINLEQYSGRVKARHFAANKNLNKKEDLRKINVSVLEIKDEKTVEEKIIELRNNPNVEYVEPNYKRYPSTINTNDPYKDLLWALENTGQNINGVSGINDADVDAPEAWAISDGSENEIIVAVIDSGVAYNHPDLQVNMWDGSNCVDDNGNILGGCNHGYDYEDSDKIPLPTSSSHGTHIAGTIGAVKNNDKGIIGIAPNVEIMAIKFAFDVATEIKSIDFAINNGAKIINASFAGTSFSQSEHDAIGRFKNGGGLFIAAAGNGDEYGDPNIGDNHDESGVNLYPCDYDIDNIICVAATDQNDEKVLWSDYGTISVDVGAPGVNIYSTIADSDIFSEDFEDDTYKVAHDGFTDSHWIVDYDESSDVAYSDPFVPYDSNADTWLMSADAIDLSSNNISGATLSFIIWCDTPDTFTFDDYILTSYRSNGEWYDSVKYNEDSIYLDGGKFWIDNGYIGYYKKYTENISSYLSNDFKFSFDWHTDSSVDNNLGCTIDNIKITKYTDGSDEQYDYGYMAGTSMATPHVAGLAGLIWGYKPDLTYAEVKDVILSTGDALPSLAGKTVTGKRINAYNALAALPQLDISKNCAVANQNFEVGSTDVKIGSAVITAGVTEAINITSINIDLSIDESILIANLRLENGQGNQLGSIISTPSESNLFLINYDIQPSESKVIDAYADVVGSGLLNIDMAAEGVGLSSGWSVDTFVATLQDINIIGTEVSGIIAEDTTWGLIDSPYIVTGNILVDEGVILTIDPGTEVIFYTDTFLQVMGELYAIGESDNLISFSGGGIKVGLTGVYGKGGNIHLDWCDIDRLISIEAQVFGSNDWNNFYIDNCNLVGIIATRPGPHSYLKNSSMIGGNINIFWDSSNNFEVMYNNFQNVNFLIGDDTGLDKIKFNNNNLINSNFTVRLTGGWLMDAKNNYWGTTDTNEIDAMIIDYWDDFSLGELIYTPFRATVIDPDDTISPVITLNGLDTINLYIDENYNDAGATALDDVDGNITENIIIVNPVDVTTIGTYIITYNVSDSQGNPATEVIRTVNVNEEDLDEIPPVITLLGNDSIILEVGAEYSDAGATAADDIDGNISADIITINPVNTSIIGTYEVTYNVSDSSENAAIEITRSVNVVDTTPPVISLSGENPVSTPVNTAYSDAGATALDNYDGDVTADIITVNSIDINTIGAYQVAYNVSDNAGNNAEEIIRIVNVVDISTPVITLLGSNPTNVELDAEYSDAGATALDDVDGNITDNIVVVNNVNTNIQGSYSVTYNVTDSSGNSAPEVVRIVNVADTTAPVLSESIPVADLANDSTPEYTFNSTETGTIIYSGGCASATTDAIAGDNTITFDELDDGTYSECIITVTDAVGNESLPLQVSTFTIDTVAPVVVITSPEDGFITNQSTITIEFTEDGHPGIQPEILSEGENLIVVHGPEDEAGNKSEDSITVILDTIPPVLSECTPVSTPATDSTPDWAFDGEPGIISYFGSCSSEITEAIQGENTITFNEMEDGVYDDCSIIVTDGAGNSSESLIISEFTIDNVIPAITLLGDEIVNIKEGDTYEDAGATASDNVDGDITANIIVNSCGFSGAPGNSGGTGGSGICCGSFYVSNGIDGIGGLSCPITYNVSDAAGNGAVEVTRTVIVNGSEAPSAHLSGPIAGDRTELIITFNKTLHLHADTLAISDIAILLDSILNDATGISTPISVASETNSVVWDNSNVYAPVAIVSIPSTTFVEGQTLRINFIENAVKDLVENAILNTMNVDAIILGSTQIAASPTVTVDAAQTEVVITSNQPTSITIPDNVTNATININSLIMDDGTTATATLPGIDLNVNTSISETPVEVAIPAGTIVSASTEWNGVINAPKIEANNSVSVTPDSGYTPTVSSVIEIGYGNVELTFDKAVRLLIPGAAGKYVGYSRSGTFTQIITACSADTQTAGDALVAGGNCKIDVGSDLIIWTKHFTKFATYTQTAIPAPSAPTGGGGGGGGGGGSDTTAPSISNVNFEVARTTATITWKTNESSISWLYYGTSADDGKDVKETGYRTSHSITLTDLFPGIVYYLQIKSKDSNGNTGSYANKNFVAGGANVADINSDSKVDKYDFSMMMASWGKTVSNSSDLNNDNKVDKYDFALLMSNWGAK